MHDADLVYDPASYVLQENPFPAYRRMQDEAPLYHNRERNFWALTRFDDVLTGLHDSNSLSSARGTLIESMESGKEPPPMMIFMDPPRHDVLRNLVGRAFTPRRVAELEATVRDVCQVCLDPLVEEGRGEIVKDLASRLPVRVIATLLGAHEDDHAQLKELSDRLLHRDDGSVTRPEDAASAGAELYVYFSQLVADRRKAPADDLTTALTQAEIDVDGQGTTRLSDDEIVFFCLLLGVAGNETTAKLIASGTVALSDFADERRRLVSDSTLWTGAIEELLRYDPPSHYQGRVTTTPMTWHGETVPEGSTVLLINGAANRDPRVYEDPDRYIVDRRIDRHLAFGHGVHFCLGAALARLETRIALQELLRRFPDYEVDTDRIERFHSTNIRGLSKVPFAAVRR